MDANGSNAEAEPGGTIVSVDDITTKEEANAFLNGVSSFHLFSSYVKEIKELRKKTLLNAEDEERLDRLYRFFGGLGKADQDLFRAKIPESEIKVWLDCVIEEIKSFTTKQSWISTGSLDNSDQRVLHTCLFMLRHVVPVHLAFKSKSEFFQTLADLIKARKAHGERALPDVIICDYIGGFVFLALEISIQHYGDRWPLEKIFNQFEKSGILEQYLRCSTVPPPANMYSFSYECFDSVIERLESCTDFLTHKFTSGKPCGDTLRAILDGRDGSRDIPQRVLKRLTAFGEFVTTMIDLTESINASLQLSECRRCSKNGTPEAPLSVCAGCRSTKYCSKECQKADWPMHEEWCENTTKSQVTLLGLIAQFMERSSECVFQALDVTGVEARYLAVEANFMPNEDGIIPAFHDPPMFRIVLVRDVISGQDLPEWLRGDKVSDRRRASFMDDVKNMMTESTSSSAALLVGYANDDYFFPGMCRTSSG